MNDSNKADKIEMLNFPRIIKKSEEELAKIHSTNKNSNSGLPNIAYSNGVKHLNNEFKKRDANAFKIIKNEKIKVDLAKAKFFKNMNDENKNDEKKMLDFPRVIRKSEEELAKIHHLSDSFVQRNSGLTNLANSNTIKKLNNEFKERDTNEYKAIRDEKIKKDLSDAKFFKKMNDSNKADKIEMLNFPRIIKKSEEELAKIHSTNKNSNSGLPNIA